MERIRKGDEVIVIAGKDKGKRGVVLVRVDATHVRVEGIGVVKKHVRPNPMKGVAGGIVDRTMAIVGFKVVDGKKLRVFKGNGAVVGGKA